MARQRGGRHLRPPTLGVDIGGVVVALADGETDTSFFGGRPMETPAIDGVVEHLTALAAGPFAGRVHLVSKAGPKIAGISRDWLAHHRFFERTGIAAHHLHFVRARRDKAPVCARLGVTHFVDDRLDVLAHLETVAHRYLFTGGTPDPTTPDLVPGWATVATTWAELAPMLAEN